MKKLFFIRTTCLPLIVLVKRATALVSLLAVLVSCNKFLDVRPEGELPEKQLLVDAAGFEAALYGVYASLNNEALYGANMGGTMLDVMAGYFQCQGNTFVQNLQKYNYGFSSVEAELTNIWTKMYEVVAYDNNILKNLQRFSPEKLRYYNLYKGEALGIRAFLHFDLVRLFGANIQRNAQGQSIPYSTEFSLKSPEFEPLPKIYEHIIADLKQAESLLGEDSALMHIAAAAQGEPFLQNRTTHFNLVAVRATLARVYLALGDNVNAAKYAMMVIGNQDFALLDKSSIGNGIFKGVLYPKEAIFGLYSTQFFAAVRDRFLLKTSFYSYDNRNDMSQLYNNVSGGHDYRWDGFFKMPVNQTDKVRFTKFLDPYQENDQEYLRPATYIKGINLIRLPELYYIAAEALLSSDPAKATSYFDQVLKSRGLLALEDRQPAASLTLEMITGDRYKEFIGEGQSFFNMKRLYSQIVDASGQTIAASDAVYVPAIPKIEMDYRN